jgi:hypothetical protein
MRQADRVRLLFGPHRTPRCRVGRRVRCLARGTVTVHALTDAPIPWPVGKRGRALSLVLCGDLARAVRRESVLAVAHWWGVNRQAVWKWRKALGVTRTEGTARLQRVYLDEPWAHEARRKAWAKARDSERCARIATALRGKRRSPEAVEASAAGRRGKPLRDDTRRKMSETHWRRGTRPPWVRPWTPGEDEAVRTLRPAEAVEATGRTLWAVLSRRHRLGVPDGRAGKKIPK